MKVCTVCRGGGRPIFKAQLLSKYEVAYFHCDRCGLVATEKPYWLEEAYSDAIARTDTGLVARNLSIRWRLAGILFALFGTRGRYLDASGGTGLLVRLMRDCGFDFYWEDRYCANTHARGFEFEPGGTPIQAVTAFEVLEHLEDPLGYLQEVLARSGAKNFIFSTLLYGAAPPAPGSWWYYSPETGQHISFYATRTLRHLADQLDMRYVSCGRLHLFLDRNISTLRVRLAQLLCYGFFPLARVFLSSKTQTDSKTLITGRPADRII